MRISRRRFLSLGLAAGAAASVQSASWAFFGHVMRTADRMDTPVPTVCRACPAGCGIVGYVRNKELVAIMGNPEHPTSRGKLCALALAAINLRQHPERLLRPMRGDGKALDMTAAVVEAGQTIARLVAGGARVVIDTWDEAPGPVALAVALGDKVRLINREALAAENRVHAMEDTWGVEVRPDLERADLLLVFGANPFEGGPRFIQDARQIAEARAERGAKMIVFDPRLSNTAGRADLWVPLKPGTDRVAALAVLRYALERTELNGLRAVTGRLLPESALTDVVDAYDLPTAARLCGVDVELLTRAGEMYVASRTPATMVGGGVFDHPDADDAYHAIALLDVLRGPRQVTVIPRPWLAPTMLMASGADAEQFYQELEAGRPAPTVLITHRANPAYERGPAFARALRSGAVAYHLSISPFANETTALAHLTLPEALPIESSARVWLSSYVASPTYVAQRPVVAPPPDVWTAEETFRALARPFNGPQPGDADFAQVGIWTGMKDFVAIASGIYAADAPFLRTPLYQTPLDAVKRLATPPAEEPEKNEFRLILHGSAVTSADSARSKWLAEINHAGALFVHPDDARRLRVRDGDKVRVRGAIAEGVDFTREASVFVSNGLRPGCVALVKEQGHAGEGRLAAAQRFESELDPDMDLLWWSAEGAGVNLSPLERGKSIVVKIEGA